MTTNPLPLEQRMLTIAEAADRLDFNPAALRARIRREPQSVPHRRIGGSIRIPGSWVAELLNDTPGIAATPRPSSAPQTYRADGS